MQAQATSAVVCPECGTRLEGAFSRNLGRCMICLLRVGFDDAEEPDETLFAPVADRLGNYRIERRDDGSLWELGRGAMGVTYRALDTSLRRAVALKLIDSGMGETRSGSTRTVHARSADGRIFAASKCRDRLPFRYPRRERAVLLRDGTGGRGNAGDACSPHRAARRAHDHRHRLAGQQRTDRSGKAGPGAPGFETRKSDV